MSETSFLDDELWDVLSLQDERDFVTVHVENSFAIEKQLLLVKRAAKNAFDSAIRSHVTGDTEISSLMTDLSSSQQQQEEILNNLHLLQRKNRRILGSL